MNINLFGNGFIGREYCKVNPDVIVNNRNDLTPKLPDALYFISTVDNYNVFTNPYVDIETNLTTLVRVLENFKTRYQNKFTFNFISSWFVYGKVDCPVNEDANCNPTGFYSITKRAAEQLLASYCKTYNIDYRIIRISNTLGISDEKVSEKRNALQYMIRELACGRDVNLYRGTIFRDYMDVRDTVRAINLIVERGNLNEIYNVGGGVGRGIGELLEIARNSVKNPGSIKMIDVPEFHKTVQAESMYMDIAKLRYLGFVFEHDIYETISEIARHYEAERES